MGSGVTVEEVSLESSVLEEESGVVPPQATRASAETVRVKTHFICIMFSPLDA